MRRYLLLVFLTLAACQVQSKRSDAPAPEAAKESEGAPAAPAVTEATPIPTQKEETHHHVREVGPTSATQALGWLKNGNIRFTKGRTRKDGQGTADIKRLSQGQRPHTVVLSCSDSRVPPEVVFDQRLGEIFTVRVAGQVLSSSTIGSIEYAVEHLGSNLILVMGHSSCGAVKAAHGTLQGGDAGSPALNLLVKNIHPRISSYSGKAPSGGYIKESWANIKGIGAELLEKSAIIKNAVESGHVKVAEALYDLESGVVYFH